MSLVQNPILEIQNHILLLKQEKLEINKKEFTSNVKLISDIQAIFVTRLEIEQSYLNQFQKLSKMVENFNKNYFQETLIYNSLIYNRFCPDLFSPFESFHAIQLDQKQKLVQSLEADIVLPIKTQSNYILSLEQNIYMNCKSIIDSYNSLFFEIPKIKNDYISTRDELSSAWEVLNSAQMNSTSFKTIEKCQKKFQLLRGKKEEKMDILHQKLKNLRHSNRFYAEMEVNQLQIISTQFIDLFKQIQNELDSKYENFENQKSDLVFDSISKYFVQEVHYMTSQQYDFKNILGKLNDEEGKDKIKLLKTNQIDQANIIQPQQINESFKSLGKGSSKQTQNKSKQYILIIIYVKDVEKKYLQEIGQIILFNQNFINIENLKKYNLSINQYKQLIFQLKAIDFLKKMSNQPKDKSNIITFTGNELDGVLNDEWKMVLRELQEREEKKQKQVAEQIEQQLKQENNKKELNQQQKDNSNSLQKDNENNNKQSNQSDNSENGGYQYINQQEINQALD